MIKFTKAVKDLLFINLIVFLFSYLGYSGIQNLVLYPTNSELFELPQLFTYMFVHASGMHIILNMIGLVVFGPELERNLGTLKFMIFYLVSGILAGLAHSLFIGNPVVGASGAIWSLMVMYALMNPNQVFLLYFFIPAKIKYVILVFFSVEVYQAFAIDDNVSHIAHITGAVSGFFMFKLNKFLS